MRRGCHSGAEGVRGKLLSCDCLLLCAQDARRNNRLSAELQSGVLMRDPSREYRALTTARRAAGITLNVKTER